MSVRYSVKFKTDVQYFCWDQLIAEVRRLKCKKFFIVDRAVEGLYQSELFQMVDGSASTSIVALESNKSIDEVLRILNELSAVNLSRNDVVIAVGGGITLDIAAFAASIYKRGCRLALVPTTFLAMIDAAIGGKTGVNREEHKNAYGSFYPAERVFVNTGFLESLPEEEMLNGWAECIKVALIFPNKMYNTLVLGEVAATKDVIRQAIKLKEDLCRHDLFDRKNRRKLNLGHTYAHLIESVSDFRISHGRGVAIGIYAIAALSKELGMISTSDYEKILRPLNNFNFPKRLPKEFHNRIVTSGESILDRDKKKVNDLKVILFNGFQNTKICTIADKSLLIDQLLKL